MRQNKNWYVIIRNNLIDASVLCFKGKITLARLNINIQCCEIIYNYEYKICKCVLLLLFNCIHFTHHSIY